MNFTLISYDVDTQAYSYVGEQTTDLHYNPPRCIVSSIEKLYLFESEKIYEMNKQYEVLDTITSAPIKACFQRFTNKEGMIFILDLFGMVYCFDPFGERKLSEVQDLQQD